MLKVGLCGGLGSGKSTVARALAARGALVIDTDEVARQVLAPGTMGAAAVLAHFGPAVAASDGTLDRRALARLVFSDPAGRLALEQVSHPLIRAEVERRLASAEVAGAAVAVVEIPLLDVARRRQFGLDAVVLVDAPEDLAVRRAVRRGMSEDDARARLAAQPTPAERLAAADRVIDNSGSLADLDARAGELWQGLAEKAEARHPRARPG
ncbi:MAG: dephospho-CoA kinase [Acidimicrobiales bacterium]